MFNLHNPLILVVTPGLCQVETEDAWNFGQSSALEFGDNTSVCVEGMALGIHRFEESRSYLLAVGLCQTEVSHCL